MIQFTVNDMTCGHCVATITKAVETAFPTAEVKIDLDQHKVSVDHVDDAAAVKKVIQDEGYTPVTA